MRAWFSTLPLIVTLIRYVLDSYVSVVPMRVLSPPCSQVDDLVNLAEEKDASKEFANYTSQYTMMSIECFYRSVCTHENSLSRLVIMYWTP